MQHAIDESKLGGAGKAMTAAVEACVHCGFCLPACPTYQELGEEMDSPRGRILLMKEVLEENLAASEAQPYIDRCLGCLACEPACPSGVRYRDLLHGYRAAAHIAAPRPVFDRLRRYAVHRILPSPGLFRLALRGARLLRPLRGLAADSWRPMLDLAAELPKSGARPAPLPRVQPATGQARARVAPVSLIVHIALPTCLRQQTKA